MKTLSAVFGYVQVHPVSDTMMDHDPDIDNDAHDFELPGVDGEPVAEEDIPF